MTFRHVVMLQWTAEATDAQRAAVVDALRRLPAAIPEIRQYDIGVDARVNEGNFDLVVVAGDDTTDESMYLLEVPNLVSINVGDRPTQAQHVLPSPAALRSVLEGVVSARPPAASKRPATAPMSR